MSSSYSFGSSSPASSRGAMKRKKKSYDSYTPRKTRVVDYKRSSNVYIPRGPMELKVFDVTVGATAISTGGSFVLLHNPVPGMDFNNRIGRKTLVRSMYSRIYCETSASNGVSNSIGGAPYRWIFLVDTQPNGSTPVTADLLTAATPDSHLNLNNRDRFKILKDKYARFGPFWGSTGAGTTAYGPSDPQNMTYKYYRKIRQEVIYNAVGGGTIADITSGAIYFFIITSAGPNTHFYQLNSRTRFDDA